MCHGRLHPSQEIRGGTDREADRLKTVTGWNTAPRMAWAKQRKEKKKPFPPVFQQTTKLYSMWKPVQAQVSTKHSLTHHHKKKELAMAVYEPSISVCIMREINPAGMCAQPVQVMQRCYIYKKKKKKEIPTLANSICICIKWAQVIIWVSYCCCNLLGGQIT